MIEHQHIEVLDRAPHQARDLVEVLLDRAKLVRSPRRLLAGVRKRIWRLSVVKRLRRAAWVLRSRANGGVCSVEISTNFGFFAHLTWCLYALRYCEYRGLIPDLRLTGDSYRDHTCGPNWLRYYFDVNTPIASKELAKRVRYTKRISAAEDVEQVTDLIKTSMTLDEGVRILNKYLSIKPPVDKIVADFWGAHGLTGQVLGVHFRGTDKSWEAPRVSWEHCRDVVRRCLQDHDLLQAVFVASDEQKFVDFLKVSIRQIPVYSRDDHHRSIGGSAIHLDSEGRGYEKGEDALVNSLLLAKCSILIRTTSTLSAWASLFNPQNKVILLNKPYRNNLWYPENEIMRKPDTEFFPERS
jgi:hypothetical protein